MRLTARIEEKDIMRRIKFTLLGVALTLTLEIIALGQEVLPSFAFLGIARSQSRPLLWPAAMIHGGFTLLLARSWLKT
jgi:hypothetical protein